MIQSSNRMLPDQLGTQDRGCGYFMWMDDLRLHISSSSGSSTPPSFSPGSSRSAHNLGKAECSNYMLEKILSGSPCLETLELNNCYGYRRINVTSKSINELVFSGYNSDYEIDLNKDYIVCVKINAPYISSLTIEGFEPKTSRHFRPISEGMGQYLRVVQSRLFEGMG
nr:hypothetical protein [Tanacetum cinerariifolium]